MVQDVMSDTVNWIGPETTLCDAARKMREEDVGCLPVGENDRLIGMITDRDIVVRGVAENKSAKDTPVRDAMSKKMLYLFEDQSLDEAAENMAKNDVRRLPVLNRDKRMVGIISLSDLAQAKATTLAGEVLRDISRH